MANSGLGGMDHIREMYGVPARRGMRIRFEGTEGTILSAKYGKINARLHGNKRTAMLHPTWHVEYEVDGKWKEFP